MARFGLEGLSSRRAVVAFIVAALAVAVPFQYLVRKYVVVGLASEHAHSHAHGEENGEEHAHEDHEEHVEQGGEEASGAIPSVGVFNGGFEVGTRESILGWFKKESGGAYLFRDERVARSGFASAAVSSQDSGFVEANWFSRLSSVPRGYDLVFEGQVRGEGIEGQAFLGILVQAGEGEEDRKTLVMASCDALQGTNDWTPLSLRCHVPPESSRVWLECGMYGKGKVWFDDLSVRVEERQKGYPPPETNLLENPSFEEGLRGWHLFLEDTAIPPTYSTVREGRAPGYVLRLENRRGVEAGAHTGFYQTMCGFSEKTGTLTLSGSIRAKSVAGRAWIDVVAFGAEGSLGFMATNELRGDTDWVDFRYPVPVDGKWASFMVRLNLEGEGVLYVDDLHAVFR